MRNIKSLFILCLIVSLTSCIEDETTNATRPLSEITIQEGENSIQQVYNIKNGDELIIEPQITQSNKQKSLAFTWEVDSKVVSTESVYQYHATQLGTFQCRLTVENEDGKTFFPFTINVNTKFEEGLTIISKDAEGNSRLSFMLTPTDGSAMKFYDYDCFADANPDLKFADNVVDIVKCGKNLIVACQGNAQESEHPTVYFLNDKTFVWENVLSVPEYADFKPTRLAIPSASSISASYPILCEGGNVYEISISEGVISKPTKLLAKYAQPCVVNSRSTTSYELIFWDKGIAALTEISNGYGPIYCSSNSSLYPLYDRDVCAEGENYFAGGLNLVTMVLINKTRQQLRSDKPELIVFTNKGPVLQYTKLATSYFVEESGETKFKAEKASWPGTMAPFTASTPCIANETWGTLLYAKGNKVMSWYFDSSDKSPAEADELLTVGTDKAVITSFEISADHQQTYVAFYEPDQPGLNGSVWVFSTENGTVLEKYDNVCYQPVKMFYKVK